MNTFASGKFKRGFLLALNFPRFARLSCRGRGVDGHRRSQDTPETDDGGPPSHAGGKSQRERSRRLDWQLRGILLNAILHNAGVPQGESLRGDALQLCVLIKATDGYKACFTLAELDPLFTDRQVLLAYRRNGADLDAKTGPLRLVIPDEKRQSRWVRQVTQLEIVRVAGEHKP